MHVNFYWYIFSKDVPRGTLYFGVTKKKGQVILDFITISKTLML